MEIQTKNNRTLIFREFPERNLWETIPEITSKDSLHKPNYHFSFKSDLIQKEYDIDDYDFSLYLKKIINYFIENETRILNISRKVVDDISNINDEENYKYSEENSTLHHIRILNIVNYSFKVIISTNYGYDDYAITYIILDDNKKLLINKIKRKQCY